ncbi:MAG: exonuclease domain-containing protein [Bacillota bacterium]|nr:exonuclease domain-containing protein [Bacillota bacterium]
MLSVVGRLKGSAQRDLSLAARVRHRLAAAAHLSGHLPLAEARFVAFDTETTGFYPHRGDAVIALGAVVCHGGEIQPEQSFHQLVNPGRPVPRAVQELTGITDEVLRAEGVTFLEAFDRFLDFAGDAILVGHGADFDLAFLDHELRRTCRGHLRHLVLDTRRLYHFLYPELADYSLDALLDLHGIPPAGRHTALGDAVLAAELFRRALPALSERNCRTVRAVRRYAVHQSHLTMSSLGCLV